MQNLDTLRKELMAAIGKSADSDELEILRVEALGKKGRVTQLMKELGTMDAEERQSIGQSLNSIKNETTLAIEERKITLANNELETRLLKEKIDVTLPTRPEVVGRIHPISQTIDEVVAILGEMGLQVAEGPDIEDDWHNFTALNIPPDHPARQEHDTFYLPGETKGQRMVLRTHTSPVQIRTMQNSAPPFRIIAPGRT